MLGSFFNTQTGEDTGGFGTQVQNAAKIGSSGGMFGNGGMFSGANFGSTIQGFGTLAGVIGNIFAQREDAKYKDKLFGMEKERIANEKKRQDRFDNGMRNAWG